jgi:hypothetical protein
MKKTVLLMLLVWAAASFAQQNDTTTVATAASAAAPADAPANVETNANYPRVQLATPTYADLYCAGFISKEVVPDANYVAGGLNTPNTTKYVNGDIVYLAGEGYQPGAQFTIVRELYDINRFEAYSGQHALLAATGQPYAEVGRVKVLDTRNKTAVAQIEFSCDSVLPGDIAIPFAEKTPIAYHAPIKFDRFAPPSGKLSGRIVLAKDFDNIVGTGMKVYLNVGSNQGVKVGDYFRAVRSYSTDRSNPVDSLSFNAPIGEDSQKKQPSYAHMFGQWRNKGIQIDESQFPRRAVGEVVVLSVTPTTSTAMVTFALEDVHAGDGVELSSEQ